MSEATNTPRTDDLVVRYIHMNEFDSLQTDGVICIVDIEAVRQLERELTQAQAELVKQSELVQREWLSPAEAEGLRRELAAVKAERDGLRADAERLEAIASGEVVVAISSNGHAARLAVSNGLDANSWHVAPSLRTAIDAARKEGE